MPALAGPRCRPPRLYKAAGLAAGEGSHAGSQDGSHKSSKRTAWPAHSSPQAVAATGVLESNPALTQEAGETETGAIGNVNTKTNKPIVLTATEGDSFTWYTLQLRTQPRKLQRQLGSSPNKAVIFDPARCGDVGDAAALAADW